MAMLFLGCPCYAGVKAESEFESESIFSGRRRSQLKFVDSAALVQAVMKSSWHTATCVFKYWILFFSRQNVMSLTTAVDALQGWLRIRFLCRSCYPDDKPIQLTDGRASSKENPLDGNFCWLTELMSNVKTKLTKWPSSYPPHTHTHTLLLPSRWTTQASTQELLLSNIRKWLNF